VKETGELTLRQAEPPADAAKFVRGQRSGFDVLVPQPKSYLIRWRLLRYAEHDLAV